MAGQWSFGLDHGGEERKKEDFFRVWRSLEKIHSCSLGFFSPVALIPFEKIIRKEKPKRLASISLLFIIGITDLNLQA